jgi:beta-galactosidase
VGTIQPNYGLDEVFGARESYVEFLPDISDELMLKVKNVTIYGRYFRQEYNLLGGTEAGQYENGKIAAVEHRFGQGRTLLIGSFPGAGYYLHHAAGTRDLFSGLLEFAGVTPATTIDDTSVQARLHQGDGGTYLWVTNPTRVSRTVRIGLAPSAGHFTSGEDIWGDRNVGFEDRKVIVSVQGRDAAVIALR